MNQSTKPTKLNHLLFAGEVLFTLDEPGAPQGMHGRTINALVKTDVDYVSYQSIATAQQTIQANLIKQLGEDSSKIQIVDVVILNVSKLGWMTEDEFNPSVEKLTKTSPNLKVVDKE